MKKIIYIVVFIVGTSFLFSCTPDDYEIFEPEENPSLPDSIQLVPNSHILYADGIAELNIQIRAFKINKVWRKDKVSLPDGSFGTKDSLHTDVYKIQNSRLNAPIEFYKEDGSKLPDNARISTTTVEDFKIYAKVGDLQSDLFQIDVREPFPEKEKKVIPVIFHILESEDLGEAMPQITQEFLKQRIDEMNVVFSQRALNASNSANPNIEFKMALYAPDGSMLEEEGVNRQSTPLSGNAMKSVLVEHTWDPKKYMNIWMCAYPPSNKRPNSLLYGRDTLDGLNIDTVYTADEPLDLSVPENNGIIFGGTDYRAYGYGFIWNLYISQSKFATYLGLFSSGGKDYCSDTYEQQGYTFSYVEGWVKNTLGFLYYPTNVFNNQRVFTAEQVERMHWVLENCPTHWAWKSDFAFTGME